MTTTLKAKEKQKATITTRQLTPEEWEQLEVLADIALELAIKKFKEGKKAK